MSNQDTIIFAAAGEQHGIVTRAQLRALHFTDNEVDGRIRRGLLRPLHRGVFQVGPVAAPLAPYAAAWLACGRTAAICRTSAGAIFQVLRPHAAGVVEVGVAGSIRSHAGVRVHRLRTLLPAHITEHQGIRVTTPARTLLDLASAVSARDLERALAEAFALRLVTEARMRSFLARHAGWRGARTLAALLGRGPAFTRSEAEARFLELARSAQLPPPKVNARLRGFEVDFLWPEPGVVVEVDGFHYHHTARAFERDRARDAELAAAGIRVIRVTWRQLTDESNALLVRLARALG